MTDAVRKQIDDKIKSSKVMLFMKGVPEFPQCGFSAATVECLERLGAKFEAFDVLSDQEVREGIKEYSSWPTIPQLYLDGELIGGCDIVIEMFKSGELKQKLETIGAI